MRGAVTLLLSGFGIVGDTKHIAGASLRRVGSKIAILVKASAGLRGSIVAKYTRGIRLDADPSVDEAESMAAYRRYFDLVKQGAILSAPDIGEGGLAVALAEMAFSGTGGLHIATDKMPLAASGLTTAELLFGAPPAASSSKSPPNTSLPPKKPTSSSSAKPRLTRISTSPTTAPP